jgi:hypothetical protein
LVIKVIAQHAEDKVDKNNSKGYDYPMFFVVNDKLEVDEK